MDELRELYPESVSGNISPELLKAALARAEKGEAGTTVSQTALRELSARWGAALRELEAALLEEGVIPLRYLRGVGTFGAAGQAKLLRSSAAVVGCGGLGGWITELLARAGVGRITLIDGDVFSESNLNRQVLCTESNLGLGKAEAAAVRVREINGAAEPSPRPVMLTADNAEALLEGSGIAFDALDNLASRLILLKAAQKLKIPMVHGAIAGWWGQFCALPPEDGVWSDLRTLWEGGGGKGIETSAGTPSFTPAAVASMQVALGIRMLLGSGKLDLGKSDKKTIPSGLFWLDTQNPAIEKLNLK